MTETPSNPRVGDLYEDRNRGEKNRRLRLVSEASSDWKGRQRFMAQTVSNDARPHLVDTTTVIGAHTLRACFTKVEG